VLNPKVVQQAIDALRDASGEPRLLYYGALIILISAGQGVFRFLMRLTVNVVSRQIEFDLRNDLFARLMKLSTAFYQENRTGDLMSRLTNDLANIRMLLGPGIMFSINTLTSYLLVLYMMLTTSPLLTIFAFLPTPLIVFTVIRFGKKIREKSLLVQDHFARISNKVQENLSGQRIVKAFSLEQPEWDSFNRLNREYIQKSMDYARIDSTFHPLLSLIIGMGAAVVLLAGGRLIILGRISLGEFVAFNLYMGMLVWPSIALGWIVGIFQQARASQERLNHILLNDQFLTEPEQSGESSEIKGEISFDQVSVKYSSWAQPVLEAINLHIRPGEIIGIVGRTGAGKSTLIHLMPRLIEASTGRIEIDGRPIESYPLHSLRSHIGYIGQDVFLFSDTIRNNIALGHPDAELSLVQEAARTAMMHEVIMEFENNYETLLGERGVNLSGGQKQRVALARALLNRPKILLLDDALSAVDTLTEQAILNNLRTVMKHRTCLWVSHRISAIMNADRIIVLEHGRISAMGRHDQLLAESALYAGLYEKQQLESEIGLLV